MLSKLFKLFIIIKIIYSCKTPNTVKLQSPGHRAIANKNT